MYGTRIPRQACRASQGSPSLHSSLKPAKARLVVHSLLAPHSGRDMAPIEETILDLPAQ